MGARLERGVTPALRGKFRVYRANERDRARPRGPRGRVTGDDCQNYERWGGSGEAVVFGLYNGEIFATFGVGKKVVNVRIFFLCNLAVDTIENKTYN